MALIDEVQLELKAGKGGDGVVRWIREKFKPKGGPGGGNGGRGGDVIVTAISDLQALDTYRFKKKFIAEAGHPGDNWNKDGRNGETLELFLPVGSIITNTASGDVWELTELGESVTLLKGGHGGLGNAYFKSSRNTTPYESTPGKPGEAATFRVELQLIAHVGLIGLPSAGKSTLLNVMTNAQSKVGAYHFTTLEPHLGVTPGKLILADIPGLIEGASDGKGLGHKFLRHIKRTSILAHCVSVENEDMATAYQTIRGELAAYSPELESKHEVIIMTKTDLVDAKTCEQKHKELRQVSDHQILSVSSEQEETVTQLAKALEEVHQDLEADNERV